MITITQPPHLTMAGFGKICLQNFGMNFQRSKPKFFPILNILSIKNQKTMDASSDLRIYQIKLKLQVLER